ncbi:XdhC family aldehyde oxidoreductase maturation factor [Desulforhopalus singaporensis]|uniref:Xanthine dehydrogenase accessory factor n=1 Tax=Desulforhopalus singaporensis TaxID=91360 RepID=A0A1H0SKZ6_9BACT|nr:XdhC/CoxI family protein [Desulforhopalus singaporensis]SDP42199.1 xanthine dehydrogenase accessory factor [Desulforhopalus singaporensis]
MRNLLDTIVGVLKNGEELIVVGITRSSGSAPRTSGARMVVLADGTIRGTVGGGILEGRCIEESIRLFGSSSTHKEIDFSLDAETIAGEGMICGGAVSVLLHRIGEEQLDMFEQLLTLCRTGMRPLLLTLLPGKASACPQLIIADRDNLQPFGSGFYEFLMEKTGRAPYLVVADGVELFVEPLVSPGVVHLIGAGHVSFAAAKIAAFTGFEVVVVDDRSEFASHNRFPEAHQVRVVDSFDSCFDRLTADDYVVIVTRGHLHDKEVLAQALGTDAGYIGMIGSRKKRDMIYDALRDQGVSEASLARVYSPIGLSIGADTPNEIALSIVGELVKVRAEGGMKKI